MGWDGERDIQIRYLTNRSVHKLNTYITIHSIYFNLMYLGDPFAVMDSVGEYTPQSNNPIFYTNTTLVCLTDYDTQVMWYYRERTLSVTQAITTPNTDIDGISTYIANITKPGFYSFEGSNYASAYIYTAGVFDRVNTRGNLILSKLV